MTIGIIGAGFMGSMHARIISGMPGETLYGIAAKTPAKAAPLADELRVRYCPSVDELIHSPRVDIVDICTPTETHARLARACMEAGKHVIVEYPLCETREELEELLEVSRRTNRVCAGAYYSRFQSQYAYFSELARSDKIGKIKRLAIARNSSSFFSSGDIVNNLMAQDIDCAVRLMGTPNSFTCANTGQSCCVLVFTYDSAIVTIEGSTGMHENYPFTTRHTVSGENGALDLEWSFVDSPRSLMKYSNRDGVSVLSKDDYDPYRYELERIIGGIKNGITGDFDIQSLYDAALLAFRCRDAMR
jgi:predicted dehydrogenase